MRTLPSLLLFLCLSPALLAAGSEGSAADPVDVEVTFVVGNDVYLDRGRTSGLSIGDTAVIRSRGEVIELDIIAVAGSTARARPIGPAVPIVGDRGTVTPRDGGTGTGDDQPPPWQREGHRTESGEDGDIWDGPLLAPAPVPDAETRDPFRLEGRLFLSWVEAREEGDGRDTRSASGRSRLRLYGEELLAPGDEIEFDGQIFTRVLEPDPGEDDDHTEGRLGVLAYRSSWSRDRLLSYQVGRFYGRAVPELGRHDGAEVEWRPSVESGFGVMVGSLAPRSTDESAGDDASLVGYYRYVAEDPSEFSGVVAYQHTWHRGSDDRDLLFARGQWEPIEDLDLWGALWLDLYSDEDVKSDGAEISQLWLQAVRAFGRDHRLRVSYQELRFPELARNEEVLPALLDDGFRRSVRASTQHRLGDRYIVSPAVDWWEDQEDDGISAELELRVLDLLADGQEWRVAVFRREGRQTTSPGVLASFRQSFRTASFTVGHERRGDDYDEWVGGDLELDATRSWGQLDWYFGRNTSAALNVEYFTGDDVDGWVVAGSLQYRF